MRRRIKSKRLRRRWTPVNNKLWVVQIYIYGFFSLVCIEQLSSICIQLRLTIVLSCIQNDIFYCDRVPLVPSYYVSFINRRTCVTYINASSLSNYIILCELQSKWMLNLEFRTQMGIYDELFWNATISFVSGLFKNIHLWFEFNEDQVLSPCQNDHIIAN